ncbi:MAG: RecX family transcriptional regulator [Bacilli bacterium]
MSIEKPYENTGDEITNIKFLKSSIKIEMNDGTVFSISEDAYVSDVKLYIGKHLTSQEREYLKESQDNYVYETYLNKLLNSGKLYSAKKIKEKLMKVKHASSETAEKIVKKAYDRGIINDEEYIQTYIQDAKDRGYSKKYIYNQLLNDGYKPEAIEREPEDVNFDNIEIEELIGALFSKYQYKNFNSAKESVFLKLYKMGYSSDKCEELIKNYLSANPEVERKYKDAELKLLKIDMDASFQKLNHSGYNIKEIRAKLIAKMLQKKYSFDDIINMWEENKYDIY